jgi:uncharacterized protein (TIGR03067 family)
MALLLVAAGADANKKDQEAMQGDWHCEKFVRDGQAASDDEAQALFRTVKGDGYTVSRFRKKAGAGTFKLNASKSPKEIDILPAAGPKGKMVVIRGIYKIEDGKLTMCYAAPEQERPKAFESKEESGVTLTVWVREQK